MALLDETLAVRRNAPVWVGEGPDDAGVRGLSDAGRSTGAVRALCIASIANAAAGLVAIVVLAFYLSPAELGLAAMVAPLVIFVTAVSGVTADAQAESTHAFDQVRSSQRFWRTMAVTAALSAVLIGIAPTLAWIFGTLDVLPVTIALAPLCLLHGLKAEHDAICRMLHRHGLWAWASGTGALAGLIVAVVLAAGGAGVYALIGMLIAQTGTHAVLIWAFTGWVPGRPQGIDWDHVHQRGGVTLRTVEILTHATQVVDKVLLGIAKGAATVGSYYLAYQVILIPLVQMQIPARQIAVGHLNAYRNRHTAFTAAAARIAATLAILIWPTMIAAAMVADLAVPALFGMRWDESTLIFCLLAFSSVPYVVRQTLGWTLEAQGDAAGLHGWLLTGVIIVTFGICAGLPWGGVGVASGLLIAEVSLLCVVPISHRQAFVGLWKPLVAALIRPAAVSILAVLAAVQVRMIAVATPDAVTLSLIGIMMLSISALSLWQAHQCLSNRTGLRSDHGGETLRDQAKADRLTAQVP